MENVCLRRKKDEMLLLYQTFPGGILTTHIYGLFSGKVCLFNDLKEQKYSMTEISHDANRGVK